MNATRQTIRRPCRRCGMPFVGLASWLIALCPAALGWSQDVELAKSRGPYYVGEPVVVQISVSSSGDSQDINCRYDGESIGAISISEPNVSTSRQQSMQIINGRVSQSESVDYRFSFQITALQAGSFEVGPFIVSINGKEQTVRGTSFDFQRLADDPDMELVLELSKQKIYAGERVPLKITWAFAGSIEEVQHAFSRLQIRSPLFEQFEFRDQPARTNTTLRIETASSDIEIDAQVTQEKRNGRDYVVVIGERILLAERTGVYKDMVVSCRTERVTGWSRSFFGDIRPRSTQPAVATSKPLSFTINTLPSEDQPASFSGAVGKGFSVNVSANRSVVRVGDPISLNIDVQGDGNLEKLSLPNLSGPEAFDESLFQLPGDTPSGTFANNTKQFKVTLRVKDQKVQQIPAIAFSWFNPELEKYETAHSKPIAVQVDQAQIISSSDVISATVASEEDSKSTAQNDHLGSAQPALNFLGANLAIERNTARLVGLSSLPSQPGTVISIYGLGILSIVIATWVRRRKSPAATRNAQKSRISGLRSKIASANGLPMSEAAELIARTLRQLIIEYPASSRSEADRVLAECDNLIYSPDPSHAVPVDQLVDRALAAADRLIED